MKCEISVFLEVDGKDREAVITDYTFVEGLLAVINRAPEDCNPGEPDRYEDIIAHWDDTGVLLTDEEHEMYNESLAEAIDGDREGTASWID